MATHGEIRWPPVGRFNGRLWGELHGRRQCAGVDHRSPVDHERHIHKFGNARLMWVRVDFDRFCVAVPARIVAHCFRGAFFMEAIYREIRREQTRAAFFFPFKLAAGSKRQRSVEAVQTVGDSITASTIRACAASKRARATPILRTRSSTRCM